MLYRLGFRLKIKLGLGLGLRLKLKLRLKLRLKLKLRLRLSPLTNHKSLITNHNYCFSRSDTAKPPHGAMRSFKALLLVTVFFVMV